MKILYVGGGYVGTCSAVVSADSGHQVLVYDVDSEKVKKFSTDDQEVIESCLHEEGLAEMLMRNRSRIIFTDDKEVLEKFSEEVTAIFMCLPTPEKHEANGESDLSFFEGAVKIIGPFLAKRKKNQRIVIVNKSTVPIKMIDYTAELFEREGVRNFGIVSNPEFLVEGKAIERSANPDRIVIGANTEDDFKIMREVYRSSYGVNGVEYIEVNPYEAAAGKLLANYILLNKVVVGFDVVGRTCEQFSNIGYESVRRILASDPRIGSWGLYDSLFAGGSCFIKDAGSLAHQLEAVGGRAVMVRNTLEANVFQLEHFFQRAEDEAGFSWVGKTVAVLGLAFKQGTNDIRNSGSIGIIQRLLGSGVDKVQVYDPAAMTETKKYFSKNPLNVNIIYFEDELSAIKGSDAAVICTDWPQFKKLGKLIPEVVKPPYLIMDGRRIIQTDHNLLSSQGFDVITVGSPFIKGKTF